MAEEALVEAALGTLYPQSMIVEERLALVGGGGCFAWFEVF